MSLQLYNTLSGSVEPFMPLQPERVSMYVCGPTVYNHPHIGNARPAVVFDVLFRLLRHSYREVIYVRNITDVDDKINKAALKRHLPISAIAAEFIDAYHADMEALGCLPPTIEPRATAHIADIIRMVERLIAEGYAYAAEGHVLFHVPAFPDYGRLSRRNRDDMIAGARVEVAPYKKDPADFVLWKPSDATQPGWDSPWGRGRPGWHIECSGMIEAHLGQTIDIHGGGQDLIFPHHENEIAQGTCAHGGAPYARYWLHNGFVNINAEKMSKSLGNVLLVKDLLQQAPGEAVRLALLTAQYRAPLDWSDDTLPQASEVLDKWYRALESVAEIPAAACDVPAGVLAALKDNLNTPAAIAEMHALAKALNKAATSEEKAAAKGALLAAGSLLGLLRQTPTEWFAALPASGNLSDAEIVALLQLRQEARKARDFAKADAIRDQLAADGIVIEDGANGASWRRSR